MKTRWPHLILLLVAATALVLVACSADDRQQPMTIPPPCTPLPGAESDPCEGRPSHNIEPDGNIVIHNEFWPGPSPEPLWTWLEGGYTGAQHEAHMVVRAQVMPETVRCVTNNRFRLQPYLRTPGTRVLETGLGDIECYADLNVSEYFVGAGPTTLTILAYWRSYWDDSLSEAEIATKRKTVEDIIADGLPGYEGVVFIGIPVNAAIETWTAVAVWDLERRDDGTIIAVHPDRDWWMDPDRFQPGYRELVEFTLPAFRTAATAAYASMLAKYDGRIDEAENLPMLVTNASNLRSFHVETGNVNHPDGPPTQPPPACGKAVPDQAGNPGLMRDCMALLDAKDALRGAEALNWSVDDAISDWDGITTGGTPSRVTKVEVDDEDLTGSIPAGLRSLSGLTHLDLSDNSLTGDIPAELGLLHNLVSVKLSGNSLTGCIPIALQSVPTNDLDGLGLPDCAE